MRLLNSLILWTLLTTGANATVYYVSTTGNNSWPGTSVDSAWQHLWRASDSPVASGDTVYIRSGTYGVGQTGGDTADYFIDAATQFIFRPTGGVVYKKYPGDATRPRIHGDTLTSNKKSCVTLYPITGAVLDSLEMVLGWKWGVHIEGSTDCVIKNCAVDSCGLNEAHGENPAGIGINVGNTTRLTVQDCEIFGNWEYGFLGYGMDSVVIRDCNIYDNNTQIWIKISTGVPTAKNVHIYNNTVYRSSSSTRFGGGDGDLIRVQGSYTRRHIYIHHNVLYGPIAKFAFHINYCTDVTSPDVVDSLFIYNNTIDGENMQTAVFVSDVANFDGGVYYVDTMEVFNNIVYTPEYGGYVANWAGEKPSSCGDIGPGKWGPNVLVNWNCVYDTGAGNDTVIHWDEGAVHRVWSHQTWVDSTVHGDNDVLSNPLFTNAAARDYRITSSSPAATSGRGGSWPTYMGAFAPTDTTCPTVTLVGPGNDTTIAQYSIDIIANFVLDSANDSLFVTLIGERGDATPEDTLFIDTLIADSTGWTYNWSSLTEDSTYYWYIIARDTSCADTSAIRQFTVDSIPPPEAVIPKLRGVPVRGIKIGMEIENETHGIERPEQPVVGRAAVYCDLLAAGRGVCAER